MRSEDVQRRFAGRATRGDARGEYVDVVARSIRRLQCWLPHWRYTEDIAMHHPFLYVPLVELCLRLPVKARMSAAESKVVLRTAVRGIVPENVRRRVTKSFIEPRICWAMRHERHRLERIIRNSVLADMGCIEPKRVLKALDSVASGGPGLAPLYAMLSLEMWLSRQLVGASAL